VRQSSSMDFKDTSGYHDKTKKEAKFDKADRGERFQRRLQIRKTTTTARNQIRMRDWEESHPRAEVWKLDNFDPDSPTFLHNIPPEKSNPSNAKIINPQAKDAYVFKDIEKKEDIPALLLRDGKVFRKSYEKPLKLLGFNGTQTRYVAAPGHVTNCFHRLADKNVYYLPDTQKVVIVYDGDQNFSHLSEAAEAIFEPDEKPTGTKLFPHPDQTSGENKKFYTDWYYKQFPPEQQFFYEKKTSATGTAYTPTLRQAPTTKEPQKLTEPQEKQTTEPQTIPNSRTVMRRRTISSATTVTLSGEDDGETGRLLRASPRVTSADKLHSSLRYKTLMEMKQLADKEEEESGSPVWYSSTTHAISEPKGGETYFFHFKDFPTNLDIFTHARADGLNWRQDHLNTIHNEILKKVAYYKLPDGTPTGKFKRIQYYFWNEKKYITQYIGDGSVAEARTHGNATKKTNPYYTQTSQVLKTIRESSVTSTASQIYTRMTSQKDTEAGPFSHTHSVRNRKQIYNAAYLEKAKLTHDLGVQTSLVNFSIESEFVREPRVRENSHSFICIHKDVQSEVMNIIKKSRPEHPPLMLHYDTSFNAGGKQSGFVASHLVLSHPYVCSKGKSNEYDSPVNLVISSMLHDRKFQSGHEEHLSIANRILNLDKAQGTYVFVSDNEFKDLTLWDNASHALCWNHTKTDVVYKAKNMGHR